MRAILVASLCAVACAAYAEEKTADQQITDAENACLKTAGKKAVPIVRCQAEATRALWARFHPETLPMFEAYQIRRLAVARDYDAGKINKKGLATEVAAMSRDFVMQSKGYVPPNWLVKPSEDDFIRYYPPAAAIARLSGSATLKCRVSPTGSAEGCAVLQESPTGYNFGGAALEISRSFKFTPVPKDAPPGAADVTVPVVFQIPKTWLQKVADGLAN